MYASFFASHFKYLFSLVYSDVIFLLLLLLLL